MSLEDGKTKHKPESTQNIKRGKINPYQIDKTDAFKKYMFRFELFTEKSIYLAYKPNLLIANLWTKLNYAMGYTVSTVRTW